VQDSGRPALSSPTELCRPAAAAQQIPRADHCSRLSLWDDHSSVAVPPVPKLPPVPALHSRLISSDSFWRGYILCSSRSTSWEHDFFLLLRRHGCDGQSNPWGHRWPRLQGVRRDSLTCRLLESPAPSYAISVVPV
jgi:hypothetical protein